jgi:Tol biopolymer transport system component
MLGVVDLVTGEVTELARASSKLPPSWSPDGNKIIFSGFYRPEGADVGEMAIVVVIDRATKRALSLGKGYYPAWSPDGKLIAYLDHNRAIDGKQEHLCTMKPDGTGKAVLMSAGGWFLSRQELVGPFVWSPDMRFIAYHAQAGMKGGQRDLFILDLKTKKTKKIYSELDLVLFAWKSQYHPSRNTTNEVGG